MSLFADYLLLSPLHALGLWLGAALLVFLLFLRQPATLTLASDEKGNLQISRQALHRLVEACCEQVRGVAFARARVRHRKGRLDTKLRLKVRPDAKLDAIQGYLTQEIAEIYRQNLGLTGEVGKIEVKVVGVVPAQNPF